jgi:hypothetical protein
MEPPTIAYGDPVRVCHQIDAHGVASLENAVPSDWLAHAQAAVTDHLTVHGEQDHFIRSPEGCENPTFSAWINSPTVHALLNDVVHHKFPDGQAIPVFTGSALRIIAGPRGEGEAFWFHYDPSAVTMLVPLFLPDAGRGMSGELVGFFNKRPFRRSVIVNIIDKVVSQSGVNRSRILRKLDEEGAVQRVDMKVGNLYMFWGYRSLHANLPCQSGALRATLVLHFGRLHGSSGALATAVHLQHALRSLRAKAGHLTSSRAPTDGTPRSNSSATEDNSSP